MLGTVAEATGDYEALHGGEAKYEGGLEFVGGIRGRGTLRAGKGKMSSRTTAYTRHWG